MRLIEHLYCVILEKQTRQKRNDEEMNKEETELLMPDTEDKTATGMHLYLLSCCPFQNRISYYGFTETDVYSESKFSTFFKKPFLAKLLSYA